MSHMSSDNYGQPPTVTSTFAGMHPHATPESHPAGLSPDYDYLTGPERIAAFTETEFLLDHGANPGVTFENMGVDEETNRGDVPKSKKEKTKRRLRKVFGK